MRKSIVAVLATAVAMVMLPAPPPTSAEPAPQFGETSAPEPAAAPQAGPAGVPPGAASVAPGDELASMRTATSATFTTTDPKKLETRIYSGPVHYQDAVGQWQKIDTTLIDAGGGRAKVRANGIVVDVATTGTDSQIARVTTDADHSVGFGLQNATRGSASRSGDIQSIDGVARSAGLKLDVTPDGLNFDIVLSAKDALNSYVLPLTLKGLSPRIEATSGAVVFDDEAGKVRVTIPHGYMDDSAPNPSGGGTHSEGVTYRLVPLGSGRTGLRVDLDRAWLDDPARVYPVLVDPNIYTGLDDTYVQSPYTNNYSSETQLKVGYCAAGTACAGSGAPALKTRTFLRFDYSSVAGRTIQSANLLLYNYHSYSCDKSQVVKAYRVTAGSFPGNLSWSGPTLGDYLGQAAFAFGNTCAAGWATIPITNTDGIRKWASGEWLNQGLGLAAANETTSTGWKKFYSANQGGTSVPVLIVTTAAAAPSVPTSPSALARSDGVLEARWSPPTSDGGSAITGYNVTLYDAVTNTAPQGTYFCAVATCGYVTWSGLADNTRWYFKISAQNAIGNSLTVSTNTVTVYHLPGQPTDLKVSAGYNQAWVSWTAAPTNGGPAFDYYWVSAYDNTTPQNNFRTVCGTCGTYQFTGLTNGHNYSVTVTAHNSWGFGPVSATVAVTPSANPKPYPPQYAMASPGNLSAWVSWEKPPANGGAPPNDLPTSYVVQAFDGGAYVGQVTLAPAVNTQHNTYRWTGLYNARSYTFTVYPQNAAGYGAGVTTSAVIPVSPAPPYPPRNVTATAGDSSILLTWDPPDSNGPPAVSYYAWQFDLTDGTPATWATQTRTTPAALFPDLINGHQYLYLVRATGADGKISGWAVSNQAAPASSLGLLFNPKNVHIDQRGDTQVHVTWTNAPAANGYKVTPYHGDTGVPLGEAQDATSGTSGLWVTGLRNGTPVRVKVTGNFASLFYGDPVESDNVVTPAGAPFAPEGVTATRGDSVITIGWAPPSQRPDGTPGDNGDAITGYTVSVYRDSDGQLVTTVPFSGNQAPLQKDITVLVFGTTYRFTVKATNGVGTGAESAPTTATFAGRPDIPTNVQATDGENSRSTITWTVPNNNGDPATYTVTAHPEGGTDIPKPANGPGFVFTGLEPGTGYTFTVTATNAVGTSEASDPSNRIVPSGPPSTPANAIATEGDGAANVSWDASQPNGSSPTYTVTASPGGRTAQTTDTNVNVDQLANGTTYSFTVVASNQFGSSMASAPSNPVTPTAPCTEGAQASGFATSAAGCDPVVHAACDNGKDDDGDDKTDYPDDPGCSDPDDSYESDGAPVPACSNGVDDDNDKRADYPDDLGCFSADDNNETNSAVTQAPAPASSLYVDNLGTDFDTRGCTQGQANQDALVVLAFGGQSKSGSDWGSLGYLRNTRLSRMEVLNVAKAYVTGFFRCAPSTVRLRLGVGANNSGPAMNGDPSEAGRQWAGIAAEFRQWATVTYPRAGAYGATDIEAGDDFGGVDAARAWVGAYSAAVGAPPFFEFGDAGNCPDNGAVSNQAPPECVIDNPAPGRNYTWEDYWYFAGGGDSKGIALPEIYNTTGIQARMWQQISKWGALNRTEALVFEGAFTQSGACADRPAGCGGVNNSPQAGWQQLYNAIQGDPATAQPGGLAFSTDIYWPGDRPT